MRHAPCAMRHAPCAMRHAPCAIITGAGAGIGKEIAITFATAGASVVVSDINADAANHVVDEIQQLGGQAFACRCDITSEQELSALADFAISKLGKVDILVNNAGGGGPKPFDMPMADFRRAYELNVFSFSICHNLLRQKWKKWRWRYSDHHFYGGRK